MDKFKGLAKGGWHPPGDPSISRKTWKSDLKGMATGQKKPDAYEEARNHQSRPLASLQDRELFTSLITRAGSRSADGLSSFFFWSSA